MQRNSLLGLSLIGLALCAAPAQAAYVVDTGSSGDTEFDWSLYSDQSLAAYFTLSSATTISSIEGYFDMSFSTVTISIVSDGALPSDGTLLFSDDVVLNGLGGFQGLFGKSWALAAGSYWVTFESQGSTGMFNTAVSPLSYYAFTYNGDWVSSPSLAIGIRIGDTAVPEPASWAMLISGFALVGAAMRRRQQVAVRFA